MTLVNKAKKTDVRKVQKIRCFFMVTKKETMMMMDEYQCFGAWEFVRGELLSFCCVRLLESVTRDKMSFFFATWRLLQYDQTLVWIQCNVNLPCNVSLAEMQEFLNVTWKFREKNWLIACPFCVGGTWRWGRLTEHNGGCCLCFCVLFWIFGWRIDAAKKPAKSLARRTSWVILAMSCKF